MRNTFVSKLLSHARDDSRILLISGDLGFGVLDRFQHELPKQFLNCGVAEQSMMSVAAGLASQGFRPFVYSIANFPTFRCLEQIRNDVAYMRNPVTIVAVGAGVGYGVHGYSHHAIEDIAIISSLEDISIYSPADSFETSNAIDLILASNSPAYLRLGKGGEPQHSETLIGVKDGIRVHQEGPDGAILFTGSIGIRVLEAAKKLRERGVFPTIASISYLNKNYLSDCLTVRIFPFILTVEEHLVRNGFGTLVLDALNSLHLTTRVERMGISSKVKHLNGHSSFLMDCSDLTPERVAEQLIQLARV